MAWSVVNTNNVVSYPEEPMNADMAAEVKRYLDKLGTTTAEIRISLVDLGMTGAQGDSTDCPLARYLADALNTRVRVTVDGALLDNKSGVVTMIGTGVAIRFYSWGATTSMSPCKFPEVVTIKSQPLMEFISNFDRARYPELIKPPADLVGIVKPPADLVGILTFLK